MAAGAVRLEHRVARFAGRLVEHGRAQQELPRLLADRAENVLREVVEQVRFGATGEHDLNGRGALFDEHAHGLIADRASNEVPVVDDEHGRWRVGQLVDEQREDGALDASRPGAQRLGRRRSGPRMDGLQPGDQVAPEPDGVFIALVGGHPHERRPLTIGLTPLGEHRGLSVPRRRAAERELATSPLPKAIQKPPTRRDALLYLRRRQLGAQQPWPRTDRRVVGDVSTLA
jgi:hypothetical protein